MFNDSGRLDNLEVRKELIKIIGKKKYVDDLIEQFWFKDWYNTLITIKPFFELLKKYLNSKPPRKFERTKFYDFIFQELIGESSSDKYLKLQQLAIAFEQMHTDRVKISEYRKLLTKLSIGETMFDSELGDEILFSKQKVDQEDNDDNFVWSHHTLTEYLASDFILKQENLIESIEKYMLLEQEGIKAFKHSWYGTLRFIIDSKHTEDVVEWLYQLGKNHPDNIDDDYSQMLLYSDPKKLNEDLKSNLFELIYKRYKEQILWLPIYTRNYIGKFIQKKHFSILKKDIKDQGAEVKNFVYRGNVVSVIDSLFENKSELLTDSVKKYWKPKLVKFAKDDNKNGVLQRHSLSALVHYDDPSLIEKVSKNFTHNDSLVREAFIQFCYEIAPNTKTSIDYSLRAIQSGMTIYGRYGLYAITTKSGLLYLLKEFNNNPELLKAFIDKESIFSDKGDRGDQQIIDRLEGVINSEKNGELLKQVEKLLSYPFNHKNRYHIGRSSFFKKLAGVVVKHDSKFAVYLLVGIAETDNEKEQHNIIFNVNEIIPFLLTKNVAKKIKAKLRNPSDRFLRSLTGSFYVASRKNGKIGMEAYKTAVEIGLIDPMADTSTIHEVEYDPVEDRELKRLRELLNPDSDKYLTGVFEYFADTHKSLQDKLNKKEKEKLITITGNVLASDTKSFKVSLPDRKDNSHFTWTSIASFYGNAVKVAEILKPRYLNTYRQNIINFIPFAFSSDQMTLSRVLKDVKDEELEFVYSAFSSDRNDLRYFIPSSFIQVVTDLKRGSQEKNAVKDVLFSLSMDKFISDNDRISALEKLSYFIDSKDTKSKKLLEKLFNPHNSKIELDKRLAVTANGLLINIFKDEKAISWRFDEIKKRAFPHKKKDDGEFHWVSQQESELTEQSFANPVVKLNDPKYIPQFTSLLNASLKILRKGDDKYWSYVDYMWKICMTFFEGLANNNSMKPYLELKSWADRHIKGDKSNWFNSRLKELRRKYVDVVGRNSVG